jgi:hypothetical protein
LCIRAESRRGKAPGEPYEGKLHVRFDEGVLETELWSGLRHRCTGESRRSTEIPVPVAAAPAPYSAAAQRFRPSHRGAAARGGEEAECFLRTGSLRRLQPSAGDADYARAVTSTENRAIPGLSGSDRSPPNQFNY